MVIGEIKTFDDLSSALGAAMEAQPNATPAEAIEVVSRLRQRACDIACSPEQEPAKRQMVAELTFAIEMATLLLGVQE